MANKAYVEKAESTISSIEKKSHSVSKNIHAYDLAMMVRIQAGLIRTVFFLTYLSLSCDVLVCVLSNIKCWAEEGCVCKFIHLSETSCAPLNS